MNDMTNNTNKLMDCISLVVLNMIGKTIMDSLYWQLLPNTPYYLKKKIKHLEYELINKTLQTKEEIIIP